MGLLLVAVVREQGTSPTHRGVVSSSRHWTSVFLVLKVGGSPDRATDAPSPALIWKYTSILALNTLEYS